MAGRPAGTRRTLLMGGLSSLAASRLQGCDVDARARTAPDRLGFRPGEPPAASRRTGTFTLQGTEGAEPALVRVPRRVPDAGLTLVVMLHGADGRPRSALALLEPSADATGLVLLAPKSRAATWDVIVGGYGPDVANIDRLLGRVSASCPVGRYAVGGFSDGASYALSLGIANGDVFDAVIAFSPGFEAAESAHGRPGFFVSHGTGDQVLPVDRTSRSIVPDLRERGYDVTYEEFGGGHQIPTDVRAQAARWLTGSSA